MVQEFKLFRWIDALTLGGISVVATALYIYALFNGLFSQTQAFALMTLVTAAFWGIYGLFVYHRKQFLNKITFITKHNVAVIANGYDVKQTDIESETDDLIVKWNAACKFDKTAESLVGLWVKFDKFPVSDRQSVDPLAGYTLGNNSVIGWKVDLKETAFQHELGHVVYHEYTGGWDNDACHDFMNKNNLP